MINPICRNGVMMFDSSPKTVATRNCGFSKCQFHHKTKNLVVVRIKDEDGKGTVCTDLGRYGDESNLKADETKHNNICFRSGTRGIKVQSQPYTHCGGRTGSSI